MTQIAQAALVSFPAARADSARCAASFAEPAIHLRTAKDSDLPFMRQLYGSLRAQELAQTGWPADTQQAFIDSQLALQHRHFVTVYAAADFYVVQAGGRAIGRYYLLRRSPYYLVVDIALLPGERGRGVGGSLLAWTQQLAERDPDAEGIELHVDERNSGAQRLYTRLGFQLTTHESPYLGMRWTCGSSPVN